MFHSFKPTKSLSLLCATAGLALLSTRPAQAVSFTVDNINGTWDNIQGTSTFNGTGTNQVRWGSPATTAGQSGFDFNSTSSLLSVSSGSNFVLGELTHFNLPVWSGTAASGVDLQFSMAIDGVFQAFDYSFTIDETPNIAGTCPEFQISDTPCDDKIDFTSAFSTTTFLKDGFNYSLELLGFSSTMDGLSPVSSFITEEHKASSAFLVARFVKDDSNDVSVPEPTSAAALLLIGLVATRIRRRQS
ncbi:THxN family PEP-CTERM protein [Phormidium yuhuli AB48]|uniref:THxN family PEP-CTERM protein n=1 Tax=Phormidium yuhuli AB48 TaxID=2940671 RepID=A0ABY5ATE4_9CYAN|nr:THxN family PEP-CTERM protein [Phormidium yuhuli]USR91413.1 THxN family PEP-CTERM protein [Phormidium yuhuli AB48]